MSDSPRLVPDPPASAARFGDGGDYYRPGLATRQPEYVLAAWFFLAAEEEVPEILTSLRSEVYERLPYDKVSLYHWRDEEDRWHLYEDDWNPPSWAAPATGYLLGSNPMLAGVLALRAWARRFRLTSHPLVEVAVQILYGWEEEEEEERRGLPPRSTSGWGQDFDILANGWEAVSDQDRQDQQELDRVTGLYYLPPAFQAKLCARWDPRFEPRRAFAQRMTNDLARQLEDYQSECERYLEDIGLRKRRCIDLTIRDVGSKQLGDRNVHRQCPSGSTTSSQRNDANIARGWQLTSGSARDANRRSQQVLGPARVAEDAGEAALDVAAVEKGVDDVVEDTGPAPLVDRAVER